MMDHLGHAPSVLIISDELKLVESLRGAFGSGCQIFLCPTVETGLERVRRERISAVLVNLQLPGLDVEQAVAGVRQQCGQEVMLLGFMPVQNDAGQYMPQTVSLDGSDAATVVLDWRGMRGLFHPAGTPASLQAALLSTKAPEPAEERVALPPLYPTASTGPRDAVPLSVEPHAEPGPAFRILPTAASEQPSPVAEPSLPENVVELPLQTVQPYSLDFRPQEPQQAELPAPAPQQDEPVLPPLPAEDIIIPFPTAPQAVMQEIAEDEDLRPSSTPSPFLRDEAEQLEQGNRFIARQGRDQVQGQVMRMSSHYVVCEMLNPEQLLTQDWQAEDARIFLGQKEAYAGPAKLSKVVNTGRSLIGEWTLQGKWRDLPTSTSSTPTEKPAEPTGHPLSTFFDRLRVLTQVSAVFKSTVAEMASLLEEVKNCMDRIEAGLPNGSSPARTEAMQTVLAQLQPQVFGAFDDVFSRFERVAAEIPVELAAEYHSLVRQHLHPYVMCSPFIHHIYAKPLGYAGDYGALQKLLADPYEGRTLFAKLLNAWLVSSTAGEAYRTRVRTLTDELQTQAQLCHERRQEFRTLSIGCGAGNEVVAFLKNEELSNAANMTLVDFNESTLDFSRDFISRTQREYWRMTKVRWVKQGIQGILSDEVRMKRRQLSSHGPIMQAEGYDFISCTGLLDYFSDRVCRRIIAAMWTMLAPGGRMLVCNFTPANPIQNFMTYLLDWKLIYRNADELRALLPPDVKAEQCRIEHSAGEVEVYLHVVK
jgi:extracellular factor (EF) 3-hydroxypalmitic acid methyl ester biosynthesis protein